MLGCPVLGEGIPAGAIWHVQLKSAHIQVLNLRPGIQHLRELIAVIAPSSQ